MANAQPKDSKCAKVNTNPICIKPMYKNIYNGKYTKVNTMIV